MNKIDEKLINGNKAEGFHISVFNFWVMAVSLNPLSAFKARYSLDLLRKDRCNFFKLHAHR